MSLDIWLTAVRPTQVFDANITHNVSAMWRKAGIHDALYESKDKTAAEVLPELRTGLMLMRDDPDGFRALNPPNGWGDYDSALKWLETLIAAFEECPDGVIGVWA